MMEVIRNKTHEELSQKFNQHVNDGNFTHYFTNHKDFRIIMQEKYKKAIIQQTLVQNRGDGYSVNTYCALTNADLASVKAIADAHRCELQQKGLKGLIVQAIKMGLDQD